jgi:hypothetical protein
MITKRCFELMARFQALLLMAIFNIFSTWARILGQQNLRHIRSNVEICLGEET